MRPSFWIFIFSASNLKLSPPPMVIFYRALIIALHMHAHAMNMVPMAFYLFYSALQIVREFVFQVHTGPLIFTSSARSFGFSFLIGAYSIHSFH